MLLGLGKRLNLSFFALGLFLFIAACFPNKPDSVSIFAPISTASAMADLRKFISHKYQIPITLNLGTSSILARQIANGADCDIVLMADEEWMDFLQKKNAILPHTRIPYLANELVFIGLKAGDLNNLSGTLAIADPDSVPAGRYAKRYLENIGAWESVKPKLLFASDSRATLQLVERGEAEFGLVYKTETRAAKRSKILFHVPTHMLPQITYPIAICRARRHRDAQRLFDIMKEFSVKDLFAEYGFK